MELSLIEEELKKKGFKFFEAHDAAWQYEDSKGKLIIVDNKYFDYDRFQKGKRTVMYCPGVELTKDVLMIYSHYADGDMVRSAIEEFLRI